MTRDTVRKGSVTELPLKVALQPSNPIDAELWHYVFQRKVPLSMFSWDQCGWALKESRHVPEKEPQTPKKWRRRWWIFYRAFAFYFKDDKLSSPCKGCVYLGACRLEVLPQHHGHSKCLRIHSRLPKTPKKQGGQIVVLSCLSEEQFRVWAAQIQMVSKLERELEQPEHEHSDAEDADVHYDTHAPNCYSRAVIVSSNSRSRNNPSPHCHLVHTGSLSSIPSNVSTLFAPANTSLASIPSAYSRLSSIGGTWSGPLDRSNASMASMASYVLSPLSCPHLPTNHASGAASPCFGAIPPSPHPHAVSHPPACPPPPAAPTLTVGAAEAAPCAPLTSPLPAPLQFVGVPPSPSDGTPANGPPRPPGAPTRGADGQNEESAALFSGPGGYSPSPTQSPGAVKRRHRDSAPIFGKLNGHHSPIPIRIETDPALVGEGEEAQAERLLCRLYGKMNGHHSPIPIRIETFGPEEAGKDGPDHKLVSPMSETAGSEDGRGRPHRTSHSPVSEEESPMCCAAPLPPAGDLRTATVPTPATPAALRSGKHNDHARIDTDGFALEEYYCSDIDSSSSSSGEENGHMDHHETAAQVDCEDDDVFRETLQKRHTTQRLQPRQNTRRYVSTASSPTFSESSVGSLESPSLSIPRRSPQRAHSLPHKSPTHGSEGLEAQAEVAGLRHEVRCLKQQLKEVQRWRRQQERHATTQRQQLSDQRRQIHDLQKSLRTLGQLLLHSTVPVQAQQATSPARHSSEPPTPHSAPTSPARSLRSAAASPYNAVPQLRARRTSDQAALLHQFLQQTQGHSSPVLVQPQPLPTQRLPVAESSHNRQRRATAPAPVVPQRCSDSPTTPTSHNPTITITNTRGLGIATPPLTAANMELGGAPYLDDPFLDAPQPLYQSTSLPLF